MKEISHTDAVFDGTYNIAVLPHLLTLFATNVNTTTAMTRYFSKDAHVQKSR